MVKMWCNGCYVEVASINDPKGKLIYTIARDCSMTEVYRKMKELSDKLELKKNRAAKQPL